MMADSGQVLPGINPAMAMVKGQVPVKVTNVSLGSFSERTPWSGTLQFDPSLLAAPDDRGNTILYTNIYAVNNSNYPYYYTAIILTTLAWITTDLTLHYHHRISHS